MDKYREIITKLISELSTSIEYLDDATKPVAPSVALGRLTRMEALSEKGVNEAMLSNNKKRLICLENALKRLDSSTYGICIRCQKEIPTGRLDIVPEALICVPCSEKK